MEYQSGSILPAALSSTSFRRFPLSSPPITTSFPFPFFPLHSPPPRLPTHPPSLSPWLPLPLDPPDPFFLRDSECLTQPVVFSFAIFPNSLLPASPPPPPLRSPFLSCVLAPGPNAHLSPFLPSTASSSPPSPSERDTPVRPTSLGHIDISLRSAHRSSRKYPFLASFLARLRFFSPGLRKEQR